MVYSLIAECQLLIYKNRSLKETHIVCEICTIVVFLIGTDPSVSAATTETPESEGPSVYSKPAVSAL